MSPMIFNIMVDAVVRHWRHVFKPHERDELALVYADDGVIPGTDETMVQASMDHITKSFASLGLKMNSAKAESMVMTGGRNKVNFCSAAYSRQVTGQGPSHRERQDTKVTCKKCGGLIGRASLVRHPLTAKCCKASLSYQPPTPVREQAAADQLVTPVGESVLCAISIPQGQDNLVACPVEGCRYQVSARNKSKRLAMRRHFQQRHINDAIQIEEEGLLPRCQWCGLFGKTVASVAHPESDL